MLIQINKNGLKYFIGELLYHLTIITDYLKLLMPDTRFRLSQQLILSIKLNIDIILSNWLYTATCLLSQEFGSDDTPLHESEYVLPSTTRHPNRQRRSFDHSITVTTTLDNQTLAEMVHYLNQTGEYSI